MEMTLSIALGLIVVFGIYLRYLTFGSKSFVRTSVITLIIYASFAIGNSLLDPDNVYDMVRNNQIMLIIAVLTIFTIPKFIKILKGRSVSISFVGVIIKGFYSLVLLYILSTLLHDNNIILASIIFILALAGTGIVVSLLGPILSALSICALLLAIVKSNSWFLSAGDVLAFYDYFCIDIQALRIPCAVLTAVLGLTQSVDFFTHKWIDLSDV